MFWGGEMDNVPKCTCEKVKTLCRPIRDIVIICNLVVKLTYPPEITLLVTLDVVVD